MKSRVDNKEKRVSKGEVVSTIQLRYDELMCYMFANIIQASANSSHVTFLTLFEMFLKREPPI